MFVLYYYPINYDKDNIIFTPKNNLLLTLYLKGDMMKIFSYNFLIVGHFIIILLNQFHVNF